MKKIVLVCAALAAMTLAGCSGNGADEPKKDKDYFGTWYCTHQSMDFSMSAAMVVDTTFHMDTTFAEPMCYVLTEDNYLIVDDDTMATYRYDKLDGKLYVQADRFVEAMGMDMTIWKTMGLPEEFGVTYNYDGDAARAKVDEQKSGTIMMVPYSFELKTTMDFNRNK